MREYENDSGEMEPERRRNVARRTLPAWVDYTVIAGLVSLVFWAGIEANTISTMSHTMEGMQSQLQIIIANDAKADVAVLKERTHQQDQALSDLRDTILRRLDKLDSKIDSKTEARR